MNLPAELITLMGRATALLVAHYPDEQERDIALGKCIAKLADASTSDGEGRALDVAAEIEHQAKENMRKAGEAEASNTRRINQRVVKFIEDKFPGELRRQIDYYVGRFGK